MSTTVDTDLLTHARGLGVGPNDASLIDAALRALLDQHRATEVDATYTSYDKHPSMNPTRGATWVMA